MQDYTSKKAKMLDFFEPKPDYHYKGFKYMPEKVDDGDCIKIYHYAEHQYDTRPYHRRTYLLSGSSWVFLTYEEFVEKLEDKLNVE